MIWNGADENLAAIIISNILAYAMLQVIYTS